MIEALKAKAVADMLAKIGETVVSAGQNLTGLVKFSRADSTLGKVVSDFKCITLYLPEDDLAKLGDTVTVRAIDYEVVHQNAKSEYNGFAKIELTEITTTHAADPAAGEWR